MIYDSNEEAISPYLPSRRKFEKSVGERTANDFSDFVSRSGWSRLRITKWFSIFMYCFINTSYVVGLGKSATKTRAGGYRFRQGR